MLIFCNVLCKVLVVARAFHILSVLTEPELLNASELNQAFDTVMIESGRNHLACLKSAFAGFALVDANIYGLKVARNLLSHDSKWLKLFEEVKEK